MDTGKQSGATLVLLRHGESTWNLENLFTGWHDVPLSERGVKEATDAGRLMREAAYFIVIIILLFIIAENRLDLIMSQAFPFGFPLQTIDQLTLDLDRFE